MEPDKFFKEYYKYAQASEASTKVPALFKLAQAAIESGWGEKVHGNNMFGIKANKSWTGEKVLVTTTEYHTSPNVKYPVVISISKTNSGKWKYKVKDYFRAYPSPKESFDDHSQFLLNNKRYARAFETTDPYKFAEEVAAAGYATGPDYASLLKRVIKMLEKFMK